MSKAGKLFAAEANLRDAAEVYATWLTHVDRTSKLLNEHRRALRTAAVVYARLADSIEPKAKP